jgi:flavin reductase (DIM6/NTAB) family NADH-FMN oxidoreductase RutF
VDGRIGGVKIEEHTAIEPGILYFGTPVVLISSTNEDGSVNLAPMSSAFWLGWRAVLGLGVRSQTAQNLLRTREGVLNLPSASMASAVDRLALTTGSDPVPEGKRTRGYFHVADKFGRAGLTAVPSSTVGPPRVAECPVAMEVVVEEVRMNVDQSKVNAAKRFPPNRLEQVSNFLLAELQDC